MLPSHVTIRFRADGDFTEYDGRLCILVLNHDSDGDIGILDSFERSVEEEGLVVDGIRTPADGGRLNGLEGLPPNGE